MATETFSTNRARRERRDTSTWSSASSVRRTGWREPELLEPRARDPVPPAGAGAVLPVALDARAASPIRRMRERRKAAAVFAAVRTLAVRARLALALLSGRIGFDDRPVVDILIAALDDDATRDLAVRALLAIRQPGGRRRA